MGDLLVLHTLHDRVRNTKRDLGRRTQKTIKLGTLLTKSASKCLWLLVIHFPTVKDIVSKSTKVNIEVRQLKACGASQPMIALCRSQMSTNA
jgi:hypothetical protein